MTRRRRLDQALCELGLAPDVAQAAALIEADRVVVDGAPARNAARMVAPGEQLRVLAPARFVGRGGDKLDGAIERLGLDVTGALALDVGASTGGFTDCLLARGASAVVAVDVGHDQLHERLAADPRVRALERTDLRDLTVARVVELLGAPPAVLVADVSFISVAAIAPALVELGAEGAILLVLVKPQFETDRATASRGRGVVRDPAVWREAVARCAGAVQHAGAGIMDVVPSSVPGAAGNVEFFLVARKGAPPAAQDRLDELVSRAVVEAAT